MSESASGAASAEDAAGNGVKKASGTDAQGKKLGFFARIALFVRQVISELKKVVAPTKSQLINYSLVVTGFVLIVMAYILLVDFGAGKAVGFVFG